MERGLTSGWEAPGRDQVEVGEELLVEADDALLFVLPDVEAHDRERHAGAGGGVDVLDAGDLPEQLLHGLGDALFHFVRGGAGHLHEDVDHGDDDLGLFLARQLPHGEGSDEQGRDDQQRRELGGDPGVGEAPGGTQVAGFAHWRTSTRAPSCRRGGHGRHDFLAGAEAGEDFDGVAAAASGGDQAGARDAVFDHQDGLQLAALGEGGERDGQRPLRAASGKTARPNMPERNCGAAGRSILTM